MNNQSLETLSLKWIELGGSSNGPPVHLSNLKSFSVGIPPKILSTLVRVPALQRLSSLHIFYREDYDDFRFTFRATGDGITLSVKSDLPRIAEAWQDLTEHTKPTIYHVRLHGYPQDIDIDAYDGGAVIPSFADARSLEIGYLYGPNFYAGFLDDLKQLGPQLKTIRFELREEMELLEWPNKYEDWDGCVLDDIEDLVRYRFEQGRPFSSVERMVVSESERINRLQDYVWRSFYNDRRLDRYIRPE